MTPTEAHTKTQQQTIARENLHRNCEVTLQAKGPHWGLYCCNRNCKKTGQWISWIKQDVFKSILKKNDK